MLSNTCVFLKAFLFPTGFFRNQSKPVKSSRACHVISYMLSLMLFNFQGTLPCRLSPADLHFSTSSSICQGLFSRSFRSPTGPDAASQAAFPPPAICSCPPPRFRSSLTSLPHPGPFVKRFFLPPGSFPSRGYRPRLSMCLLFCDSFVIISQLWRPVNGFPGVFQTFFRKFPLSKLPVYYNIVYYTPMASRGRDF